MGETDYIENGKILVITDTFNENLIEFRGKKFFDLIAKYNKDTKNFETSSIYGCSLKDLKAIIKYIDENSEIF